MRNFGENTKVLWHDRKRYFGLPLSFTRYDLVEKEDSWLKIFCSTGLLSTSEEEVNVYRIFDLSIYQSFFDKIFNVGTITLHCNDETHEEIYLVNIKNPYKVRDRIAQLIETERAKKGYRLGEFYS